MFFWLIFLISLIVLLAVAWVIRQHLHLFFADWCGDGRAGFYYWLVWIIIAIILASAIDMACRNNIEGALAGWIALLILVVGLGYSLSRHYHLGLSIFFVVAILVLVSWLILRFQANSTAGILMLIILVWFVIILISLIRALFEPY